MSNLVILIAGLLAFLAVGVPLAVALGLLAVAYIVFVLKDPSFLLTVPQNMFSSANSFVFMAIPMFILAGDLMYQGRVSKVLLDLVGIVAKRRRGGYAYITTLGCMLFGAVSGSGPATAAAIGGSTALEMEREGYDRVFSSQVIALSGPLGILIPPSIQMVVYGAATGQSVARLFLAGVGPGLLVGGTLIAWEYFVSAKRGYGEVCTSKVSAREVVTRVREALLALLVPVIILGGIYSGLFTPTEAAVVACVYSLIIVVFVWRSLRLQDLPAILMKSAVAGGAIMLLVAAIGPFSWVMAAERIPQAVTGFFVQNVHSPVLFLLIVNVILIIGGCLTTGSSITLLLAPFLVPVARAMNIDLLHFGAIFATNLALGMVTPPVGATLFVAAKVCKVPLDKFLKGLWVPMALWVGCVLIVTYIPQVSLFLPNLLMR